MAKKLQWGVQIMVGQRVRAYRREGWHFRHTYIEGTLTGYRQRGELLFFVIEVDLRRHHGQFAPISRPVMEVITNGTPLVEGGVSNRVEPVEPYESWLAWYDSRMKNVDAVYGAPWSTMRYEAANWWWTEDGYILDEEPK